MYDRNHIYNIPKCLFHIRWNILIITFEYFPVLYTIVIICIMPNIYSIFDGIHWLPIEVTQKFNIPVGWDFSLHLTASQLLAAVIQLIVKTSGVPAIVSSYWRIYPSCLAVFSIDQDCFCKCNFQVRRFSHWILFPFILLNTPEMSGSVRFQLK